MPRTFRFAALLAACCIALASPASPASAASSQATYVNLADSLQGPLPVAAEALKSAYAAAGLQVAAVHDVAVDGKACSYHARVLVLSDSRWTQQLAAHGPRALFAAPIRLVLYEDEAGLHLAAVNPVSSGRTIASETGIDAAGEALLRELGRIARGALPGAYGNRPYGQWRDRGLIGRTMGIMAGGPFAEKVEVLHQTPGSKPEDVLSVAQRLEHGLQAAGGKGRWQLRPIYRLDLPTANAVLIGVSGAAMEARSFAIVGAGGESRRSKYACPGLAHAAAYPIELLVFAEQGVVKVAAVDGMYRMKMFFEDAGKMKFAANMGMPGSIEDEIRSMVAGTFAGKP